MQNVLIHSVTWVRRGTGKRGHGGAVATEIPPGSTPHPNQMSPGDKIYLNWVSPQLPSSSTGSDKANFAFWSITGGKEGPVITTENPPSSPVTVGNQDVVATAWYLPEGGVKPGDIGYFIDAFDVNQGTFVDDDFVSVKPDSNLTASANNDGFVSTKSSPEDIVAYPSIHSVPFLDWLIIGQQKPVNQEDLQATVNTSAIAFAFYQTPSQSLIKGFKPGHKEAGTWVSKGVMVDGGGPTGHGPVPPWNPSLQKLLAASEALAAATSKANPQLAKDVSTAAAAVKKAIPAG